MAKSWCALTCEDWGALECADWSALDCCLTIGFDGAAWPEIIAALPTAAVVENLAADITQIDQCKAVFCGLRDCSGSFLFSSGQYSTIKAWVEAGGRLFCNGEWCNDEPAPCMSDDNRIAINGLMETIGTAMRLECADCNEGCIDPETGSPWLGINGIARILSYPSSLPSLPGVYHALTSKVANGVDVNWTNEEPSSEYCTTSYPWLSIQGVASGFVMLAGDANIFIYDCSVDNSELARRFVENSDGDLA